MGEYCTHRILSNFSKCTWSCFSFIYSPRLQSVHAFKPARVFWKGSQVVSNEAALSIHSNKSWLCCNCFWAQHQQTFWGGNWVEVFPETFWLRSKTISVKFHHHHFIMSVMNSISLFLGMGKLHFPSLTSFTQSQGDSPQSLSCKRYAGHTVTTALKCTLCLPEGV